MNKLKLYVWDDFAPDYTGGLAFAIAETVQEAQKIIEKGGGITLEWGDVKEYPLNKKIAFHRHGGG